MKTILMIGLLLLLLAPVWSAGATAEARNAIVFDIGDRVTAEDASYTREGIRLGQDYLRDNLQGVPDHTTTVYVRATTASTNLGEVGESGGNYIALFTRAPGWISAPSFLRVAVVVHEFVHIYITDQIDGDYDQAPAWIIEGTSEYLSTDAVVSRGLVSRVAADTYRYWALDQGAPMPPLETFESLHAYQSADPRVYDLSYLGVAWLVDRAGLDGIDTFYEDIRAGSPWETAFVTAFHLQPDTFYRRFAVAREAFIQPANVPTAYAHVDPQELSSPVRLTSTPESAASDEQIVILGRAVANARCIFYLTGPSIDLMHETTVNGAARLSWLVTIPAGTAAQLAELSVDCGAGEGLATIQITTGVNERAEAG